MSEGLIEIAIAIAVFAIVWLFVRWLRKRKTGA
jgi:hypothetical protein